MAISPAMMTYRILFATLGCLMAATLVYTLLTDGSPFRRELLTPWMDATLVDFYINVLAIAVWVAYKESSWINTILWVLLLICFGSITTCAYILKELFNVSSQNHVQDPLNHLLLRSGGEVKTKCFSVMFGRILFSVLGFLMLAILVFTLVTDGLPFRMELLTPWMDATLVDFYINVLAIAVWIAYKESSWINTILWVLLIICFGSIATSAYILKELFSVLSQDQVQDPLNHLLLRSGGEVKTKCFSVMFGRILFSVLGFLMLAILVFTLVTDGLPFRMELLTPWMAATLIDFYINIFAISVWVVHKEPAWVGAVCWVCLLICFGSVATCAYITIQLFRLSRKDLAYEVLLDSNSKHK